MGCGAALGEKWELCSLGAAQGARGFHPQEGLFGAALRQQNEQSDACEGSLLSSWTQPELEELLSLFLVGQKARNRANLGAAGVMCCAEVGMLAAARIALLPGLLPQLHMVSPDPVLCATVAANVAYSLLCPALWVSHLRMQWQQQHRGCWAGWAP